MTDDEQYEAYERCVGCCKETPIQWYIHTCKFCRWHLPIPLVEWWGLPGDESLGFE